MSSYPTAGEYVEAIQDPQHCFTVPDLQAGETIVNTLGLPQVESGQFAYVFKLRLETGLLTAVRCFARSVVDRQQRYQRISEHLAQCRVAPLANFEYEPTGIRVRGNLYPIVQMDWVEGSQLNRFVQENLTNKGTIGELASRWLSLIQQLESQKIAHGDLQHGNILVGADRHLRLVDYDGMWVPGMEGLGAAELGHRNYQHPHRNINYFSVGLDRFSALVIYTTLLALVEQPKLWAKYDNGDNFLFRADDLESPSASPLFKELLLLGGPAGTYARYLRYFCTQPVHSVPELGEWGSAPEVVVTSETAGLPDWLANPAHGPSTSDSLSLPSPLPHPPAQQTPPSTAPGTSAHTSGRAGPPQPASTPVTVGRRSFIYIRALTTHIIGWLLGASVIAYLTGWNFAVLLFAAVTLALLTGPYSGHKKVVQETGKRRRAVAKQPSVAAAPPAGAVQGGARNPSSPVTTHAPPPRTSRARPSSTQRQSGPSAPGRFVASTIRSRYHRPNCEWAQRIAPVNRRTFNSEAEAQLHNYKPCRVCVP